MNSGGEDQEAGQVKRHIPEEDQGQDRNRIPEEIGQHRGRNPTEDQEVGQVQGQGDLAGPESIPDLALLAEANRIRGQNLGQRVPI